MTELLQLVMEFTEVVSFVGGAVTSVGVLWLRRRRRRRALRKALLAELRVPAETIEEARETDSDSVDEPFHTEIPTTVYENQSTPIGLLSPDELEELVAYYETANVARQQLRSLDEDRVAEQFFGETVDILERKRTNAIEAIESEL